MLTVADVIAHCLYPQPLWFPQAFDPARDRVLMVRLDECDYRAAPFLDKRGVKRGMPATIAPYALLAAHTPADARRDAHWIFHISHVGSTLISRLLGEIPGVFALREPPVLRAMPAMGDAEAAARLPVLRALLSRVFDPQQRAMVKASSWISEHAAALIGPAHDGGQAVLVGMAPERFIAARLAGGRQGLRIRVAERLARLARRVPALDQAAATSDDARLAAMIWAVESCALEAAALVVAQERLRFVDFDLFITDPAAGLHALTRHFGLSATTRDIAVIAKGPLISHYSKSSGRAFDLSERERAIKVGLADHRTEITAAIGWLEATAATTPLLAAALDRYAA